MVIVVHRTVEKYDKKVKFEKLNCLASLEGPWAPPVVFEY